LIGNGAQITDPGIAFHQARRDDLASVIPAGDGKARQLTQVNVRTAEIGDFTDPADPLEMQKKP
jgi:hypothetical protein